MAKLEGYSKVAEIVYGDRAYYFAIYEDGNDYAVGDTVLLSGNSDPDKINEIISPEEVSERYKGNITGEVIGKVDISAYKKRVQQRKEKEELKKAIDKRRKEIQEKLNDEYYASKDAEFSEMLNRYKNL